MIGSRLWVSVKRSWEFHRLKCHEVVTIRARSMWEATYNMLGAFKTLIWVMSWGGGRGPELCIFSPRAQVFKLSTRGPISALLNQYIIRRHCSLTKAWNRCTIASPVRWFWNPEESSAFRSTNTDRGTARLTVRQFLAAHSSPVTLTSLSCKVSFSSVHSACWWMHAVRITERFGVRPITNALSGPEAWRDTPNFPLFPLLKHCQPHTEAGDVSRDLCELVLLVLIDWVTCVAGVLFPLLLFFSLQNGVGCERAARYSGRREGKSIFSFQLSISSWIATRSLKCEEDKSSVENFHSVPSWLIR